MPFRCKSNDGDWIDRVLFVLEHFTSVLVLLVWHRLTVPCFTLVTRPPALDSSLFSNFSLLLFYQNYFLFLFCRKYDCCSMINDCRTRPPACSLSPCSVIQSTGRTLFLCKSSAEPRSVTSWRTTVKWTTWSYQSHWKCSSRNITTDTRYELDDTISNRQRPANTKLIP